jgi:hypothetical protein
MCVVYSNRA